jgi:hypothetical protein
MELWRITALLLGADVIAADAAVGVRDIDSLALAELPAADGFE